MPDRAPAPDLTAQLPLTARDTSDPDDFPTDDAPAPHGVEAPDADVAEQERDLGRATDAPPRPSGYDADPADTAEQGRVVELDEDEYR